MMRKSVDNVNHVDSASTSRAQSSPAEAVIELVHDVMHQFRSRQYQVLRDGAHDITHMESKVMGFFSRHPGATLSDLVAHSGRDKAQLARLVKGLRERGLLTAEADTADRRNVNLRLSDAGSAVQRALRDEAQSLNARAVEGLDAAEQAQLAGLLARLKANLDAAG
jgi:DNA-binding MarR family transcriptional regulator